MNHTPQQQFSSQSCQLIHPREPRIREYGRTFINAFTALAGVAMMVALSAGPAYADGYVTMHGAACKATAANTSSVTFGNELWTNGSAANIVCPLVTQWGHDGAPPSRISGITIYLGSHGSIACTLYRHSGLFGNQNQAFAGTVTGSDWNKAVAFPDPPALNGLENNNYFILCALPAGTALYNVVYKSFAN